MSNANAEIKAYQKAVDELIEAAIDLEKGRRNLCDAEEALDSAKTHYACAESTLSFRKTALDGAENEMRLALCRRDHGSNAERNLS